MSSQNFTTFYIVRHGESEGNVQKILQGHLDFPLSEEGERQAKRRAQELRQVSFDLVFSSDLLRAHRTAEIIAQEHKLTVKTTQVLRERKYGLYEGLSPENTTRAIERIFDKWHQMAEREWMNHKLDEYFESGDEMVARTLTFIREIAVSHPGKTILTVSHGDLMKNLLMHLGWGTKEDLSWGAIKNTDYFVLETDGVEFFVSESSITRALE
ncbi:histidine phosphatase family protein [Candidatus Woesebacteria bacterium]|nr:histidine phosphatase family protein [Candidatus Woesebacteria bacterium]